LPATDFFSQQAIPQACWILSTNQLCRLQSNEIFQRLVVAMADGDTKKRKDSISKVENKDEGLD